MTLATRQASEWPYCVEACSRPKSPARRDGRCAPCGRFEDAAGDPAKYGAGAFCDPKRGSYGRFCVPNQHHAACPRRKEDDARRERERLAKNTNRSVDA